MIRKLKKPIFFRKNTINYLHNGTKIIVIYIVNTYNQDFRKKIFSCFISNFQGVTNTFGQYVYVVYNLRRYINMYSLRYINYMYILRRSTPNANYMYSLRRITPYVAISIHIQSSLLLYSVSN